MSLLNTIMLGLWFLIFPNLAGEALNMVSSVGNMGLAGVYLDIIHKRNIVYFFGFSILLNELFFETKIVSTICYILFAFSIGFYFNTINQWYFVITF